MPENILPIAHLTPDTEAEGPGRRFAIWLQGCPLRCPDCCNPQMLPFSGGQPMAVAELLRQAVLAQREQGVEGMTFLGGEPTAHAAQGLAALAEQAQAAGLSIMLFSGYTLGELRTAADPIVGHLLANTDILVDGPYDRERPERHRRWVGSANQEVHFLSSRYRADDPAWRALNTLEIRLSEGQLEINGFPAADAKGLWAIDRPATWRRKASA